MPKPQARKKPAVLVQSGTSGLDREKEHDIDLPAQAPLPEQFFVPAHESLRLWSGERRLLLGVLEDALHCFLEYRFERKGKGGRIFREVQEWFASTDTSWLYSFENICAILHLEPDYLRRGLQRWQPKEPVSFLDVQPRKGRARSVHNHFRPASSSRTKNLATPRPLDKRGSVSLMLLLWRKVH
jgi:hypothetical protein